MAETCWALESAWNGLSHSGAGGLAVRKSYLDTCTPMFIAALFIIPNTWKQHKCPSTDEWIKMMWYMYVCVCVHTHVLSRLSHIQLFATLWSVACQSPLSMGFSRQEYWNGLPWPPSGNLPNPGIKPASLTSPALAGGFLTTSITWEARGNTTGIVQNTTQQWKRIK